MISIIAAFICYFLILIAIAATVYHKNKRVADFMLGGRSMNYFVTAIAAQASDMSSWLFLAFPAAVFMTGFFELWTAIGLIIFMYLNWTFIAPRLRIATQEYNSLTLSSYFSARFADKKGYIGLTSGLFSIFFFTFYIASGLLGIGRLFEQAFDLPFFISILIGLITALIYTLVGGFLAVAWCNVFKGLFMLAVIIVVPIWALYSIGGIEQLVHGLHLHNKELTLFPADKSAFMSLLLACGWGLGYFGQPHILIYFMGIDDPKNISYSKYIGIAWMVTALAAATSIGLIAIVYFNNYIALPETLFIIMAKQLFWPFFAGVALCGIFAATLATLNNHILIAGSVFAQDLYKTFFDKQLMGRKEIIIARFGSIFVAILALLIVTVANAQSIYKLVAYAWSGLGSSFGPLVVASLYSKKITNHAALIGILSGGIIAGLWPLINTSIMPIIPGFLISSLIIIMCSFLDKRKL